MLSLVELNPSVLNLSSALLSEAEGHERNQQAKKFLKKPDCISLHALTAAALILPGLLQPTAQAASEEDSVDFQYSHYQEGKRDIYGRYSDGFDTTKLGAKLPSAYKPIEADSLHGSARVSLTDRIKFAFNYTQDTWAGATPVGTAPARSYGNRFTPSEVVVGASPIAYDMGTVFTDGKGNFYPSDPVTGVPSTQTNNRLTHVLATASPETRKQGDFKLSYRWDEVAVDVGGGISVENDYESRFANLGLSLDFNQKQTTVNLGLSYTNSDTLAILDPDALQYVGTSLYDNSNTEFIGKNDLGQETYQVTYKDNLVSSGYVESTYNNLVGNSLPRRTSAVLHGNRQDWGTQLGLSQVLNKDAMLDLGMGYTRSTGYMSNPYKLVYVATVPSDQDLSIPFQASYIGILETRPDERNQFNWSLGYNQYVEHFDAALHIDYRFAHDDWGIDAHTFEADWVQPLGAGWTATPRVRYYSQSSADFYTPTLTTFFTFDPSSVLPYATQWHQTLPAAYSSDQRLSGFGALSGGVTVAKQFAKGIGIEAGFEYYTHQGGLKLGGGGEQDFADYDYWVANAALKVNLAALSAGGGSHDGHEGHAHHLHSNAPAGVMFDHTLDKAGDVMVGYRYMWSEQAGDMLFGTKAVSPDTVRFNGCGDQECQASPNYMAMNMHMLDLMVAPTDWLTLMLMPQWMDMEMTLTPLSIKDTTHNHGGALHSHQTGGIGDTGAYALFKLFDQPHHHLTFGIGGTAPSGDVGITLRKTNTNRRYDIPIHYGMQLGSGTWDFKPSLTYAGQMDAWSWGGQVNATIRLEDKNKSGYALGNLFQASVWGGYALTDWLSTSVRGVYTEQGAITHQFKTHKETKYEDILGHVDYDADGDDVCGDGSCSTTAYDPDDAEVVDTIAKPVDVAYPVTGPMDVPRNYGGRYVDIGLGLSATVHSGALAGNKLSFEWLQPVYTDVNGYQLDRDGAMSFTWSYGF